MAAGCCKDVHVTPEPTWRHERELALQRPAHDRGSNIIAGPLDTGLTDEGAARQRVRVAQRGALAAHTQRRVCRSPHRPDRDADATADTRLQGAAAGFSQARNICKQRLPRTRRERSRVSVKISVSTQ